MSDGRTDAIARIARGRGEVIPISSQNLERASHPERTYQAPT
jgi:hypothetical protein